MSAYLDLYTRLYRELAEALREQQQAVRTTADMNRRLAAAESFLDPADAERRAKLKETQTMVRRFAANARRYTSDRPKNPRPSAPDLARMRGLDIRIDDHSDEDPNAKKLLSLCADAEMYLDAELRDIDRSISNKRARKTSRISEQGRREIERMNASADAKIARLIQSTELASLANHVQSQIRSSFIRRSKAYDLPIPKAGSACLCLGVLHAPFPVPVPYRKQVAALFGGCYDPKRSEILMPLSLRANTPMKIRLRFDTSALGHTRDLIGGLVFNVLRNCAPVSNSVILLDPLSRSTAFLGDLQQLIGDPGFLRVSKDDREDQALLRALESPKDSNLRYLILRGFPDHFSPAALDLIRRLCMNYESLGLVILTAEENRSAGVSSDRFAAALCDACVIESNGSSTFLTFPNQAKRLRFSWFGGPPKICDAMAKRFRNAYLPAQMSNRYSDLFPFPARIPGPKGTARKGIRVPIGLDEHGRVIDLTFDNDNPFGFVMGAPGKGKSKLLHTIIAGIITRYHPDDVELWIADFSRLEFQQYAETPPPHLKYLLLNDSELFVFSFLDKLAQEIERRKKWFPAADIRDIDVREYAPILFVIIDEFSKVNQVLKNNEEYRAKMEQIINGGRKFGVRILFCTQNYTSTSGLTEASRSNISNRLALQTDNKDDINNLIGTSDITAQEKEMLRHITKYHTAYRRASGPSGYQLDYILNIWLDPQDEKNRDTWVKRLRQVMKPQRHYDAAALDRYVEKHPVLISDVGQETFAQLAPFYREVIRRYALRDFAQQGESLVFWGNLISLDSVAPMVLRRDEDQNALLFCPYLNSNLADLASTMASAARSASLQHIPCEIWGLPNEPCIINRTDYWAGAKVYTDPDALRAHIHALRQAVDNHSAAPRYILVFQFPKLLQRMMRDQPRSTASLFAGLDLGSAAPIAAASDQKASFDVEEDLKALLRFGPVSGIHMVVHTHSNAALSRVGFRESLFPHVVAFRMDDEGSYSILEKYASRSRHLQSGAFLYTDRQEIWNFTPHRDPSRHRKP